MAAIFDAGRHEAYTKEKKLSILANILSSSSEVRSSKDPITADTLKGVSSIWFVGPKRDIKTDEALALEVWANSGGAVLIFADELQPVFEGFVRKFGVTLTDAVISPTYISYVDPHHVTVQQGVVNRAISEFAKESNPTFAFPSGCTLDIVVPSVPVLTSGLSSYPLNRPVVSFAKIGKGSLTVFGSPHIFSDEWIKKESNEKLCNFIIGLAITGAEELNQIDADHPEVTDRYYTPDVQSMSERLRSCIQESEKLKTDLKENFEKGVFRMDMSFVAQAQQVAGTLGLKNEPLETVKPQFDTALPPLTPAVFAPQMREPAGPPLELFDLDDAFASPKTRLAQLAQRTPAKNCEKFILQSAKILGILPNLAEAKRSGKDVLEYVLTQVVRWKKG
jgi:intraflagellar transport protein 52